MEEGLINTIVRYGTISILLAARCYEIKFKML